MSIAKEFLHCGAVMLWAHVIPAVGIMLFCSWFAPWSQQAVAALWIALFVIYGVAGLVWWLLEPEMVEHERKRRARQNGEAGRRTDDS